MSETSPGTPEPETPVDDRLDSWKEIAAYLDRDVTTVQRWEKREAMPVHRHLHDRMGSVYASRAELDAWARSRNVQAARQNGNGASPIPPAPQPHLEIPAPPARKKYLVLLAAAAALAIVVVLWLQRTEYFWRNPLADARFQTITDFGGLVEIRHLNITRFLGLYYNRDSTDVVYENTDLDLLDVCPLASEAEVASVMAQVMDSPFAGRPHPY